MSVEIIQGDCVEVMRGMADASIDAVVCDPPYHLTANKQGGSGAASLNLNSPAGRSRISTGGGFMGQEWDGGDVAFRAETWAEVLRVLKPGGYLLAFSGTRTYHRMACAIEDAGFEIRDQIGWTYGSGFPKSHNLDGDRKGWGTALKPAWEPICVARKPLIGTVAQNVQEHGTGALNIDGCRVSFENDAANPATNPLYRKAAGYANGNAADDGSNSYSLKDGSGEKNPSTLGRWPANLCHDGSDEVLALFPDSKGQLADISTTAPSAKTSNVYGAMKREGELSADSDNAGAVGFKMKPGARRLDEGSAARFFYCAKASKSERGDGNNHPTVKPIALMRYLCRLITPVGGTILDPFGGSGTTGVAAQAEEFNAKIIEMNPEYIEIIKRRVSAKIEQPEAPLKPSVKQQSAGPLFGDQ